MFCKDIECQNLSINGRFSSEEGYKYYHEDDAQDKRSIFENSKYAFCDLPTGLIKDFHEEFDTIPEAKKYVIRHKLPIMWEQLVLPGTCLGYGFFEGQTSARLR
jgi:hypothetical protein